MNPIIPIAGIMAQTPQGDCHDPGRFFPTGTFRRLRHNTAIASIIWFCGAALPNGFMPADGRCVADAEYPELADAIRGDGWPYGRCDATHFHLPDFRPVDADQFEARTCGPQSVVPLIKVKP